MTDYASFKSGATTYPLPVGNGIGGVGASMLRDCDASLFYLLEFCTAVLQRFIGPRLLAEAVSGLANHITGAVGDVIPFDPEPYLTEADINFPLLTGARKTMRFEDDGGQRLSVSEIDVSYTLPPLRVGEAERLLPVLKAVVDVISNRVEQGMDPLYLPTGSTLGANVWALAGVAEANVTSAEFDAFEASKDVFFPTVTMRVELKEAMSLAFEDFEDWEGANVHEDLADPIQPTYEDIVEFETHPAPELASLLPITGSKAGGTTVTITGTGFIVGTTPTVYFRVGDGLGLAATNVVVTSATTLTCVTPAQDAYPTAVADVVVTNPDGLEDELEAAFTYTTP